MRQHNLDPFTSEHWDIQATQHGAIRLVFKRPSDRYLQVRSAAFKLLAVLYTLACVWLSINPELSLADNIQLFIVMFAFVPLAILASKASGSENRFIPYLMEIDLAADRLTLVDTRPSQRKTLLLGIPEITDVGFRKLAHGAIQYRSPITLYCKDGKQILLPPSVPASDKHLIMMRKLLKLASAEDSYPQQQD